MGKIAFIDLSTGKIVAKEIPVKVRKMFLGGRGIDMYLLYNHVKPGIDALGPENVLLVSGGLLTGAPAPGAARTHIGGKSPISGCVGSSNMGGFFAAELRFAGFDHLLIKGRSEKPVYLMINNDRIEIKDAGNIWGQDTYDTQKMIREAEGDEEIKVMCIGPGGEKLVRYANVRTGPKNSGGRTGMGAIMGSKQLKAIAVRGTQGIEVKRPQEALDYYKKITHQVLSAKGTQQLGRYGTPMIFRTTQPLGVIRVRNLQRSHLEDAEAIMPEAIDRDYAVGMTACFGCSVHCRGKYRLKDMPEGKQYAEGPEYAGHLSIAGLLDCCDLKTLMTVYHELNLAGVDVVESSCMVAFAMELYEKGIIDEKVTDGLKLEWGNTEVISEIYRRIANRQGFGEILGEGMIRAMARIEGATPYYGLNIKGLAAIASDERATPALALGVATATRGSDHLRSRPTIDFFHLPEKVLKQVFGGPVSSDFTSFDGKSYEIYFTERLYALVDALGICKFQTRAIMSPSTPAFEEYAPLIYNITGLEFTPSELMAIGERIYTIERMFNIREGFSRKDDYLPDRYYDEKTPATGGMPLTRNVQMDRVKFDKMLDEYYELHHWDNQGNPLPERLEELGLDKEPSHML
jgi:aldehyde:ferredoxin oxidoreductase